jgi:hypothetical protein
MNSNDRNQKLKKVVAIRYIGVIIKTPTARRAGKNGF